MNPGRDSRAVNGGTLRVAWKKSAAVGNVNIFVKSGSGGETQVGTNLSGTFFDITLPGSVSTSSQVTVRIQDAGNSNRQDSVDGYFMVRGPSAAFTTALASTLQMGSIQVLRWVGPSTSYLVDLDLYEGGTLAQSIVRNLPDFGNYTWFVPEMWSASSTIRVTFKTATGTTITTANSGTTRVFYTTGTGSLVNRYRLYSPVTLEHHFTTDQGEYDFLSGLTGTWIGEGAASRMHNGPVNSSGVEGVPYYRLYDFILRWHHWTTDRNEYFFLRTLTGRYIAEGVDGYIFRTQVSGTVPWYRLTLPSIPGLHHWTSDLGERNHLVSVGWIEEQQEYVFPPVGSRLTSSSPAFRLFVAQSSAAAARSSGAPAGSAATSTVPVPVPGDLNGDGKGDLVWRHSQTGDVAVWLMDGVVVTEGPVIAAGVPLAWQIAHQGDLDGDGNADLVWRNTQTGDVAVWVMNGTAAQTAMVATVPLSWQIASVGDLDGDGKADLIWRNSQTGDVSVWLMNGAAIVTHASLVGPVDPTAWQIVAVGDVDGDGKADLVWRQTETGDVDVWLMDGATVREKSVATELSRAWQIAGVGDLDADGKTDLVWRNTETGDASAWLMNGTTVNQSTVVAAGVPLDWHIAAVRDVDGDGHADLVWRHTTSGDVALWLMNGVVVTQQPVVAPGVPLAWQIARH